MFNNNICVQYLALIRETKLYRSCSKCNVQLIPIKNWNKGSIRSGNLICNPCVRVGVRATYKRNMDNPVKSAEYKSKKAEWRASQPKGKNSANTRWSSYKKMNRVPSWADRDKCAEVYIECARLNGIVGGPSYHVDHIIPVGSETVSGFHVENNLQILKASDNIKKSNNYVQ